jgi:hypothetical protein
MRFAALAACLRLRGSFAIGGNLTAQFAVLFAIAGHDQQTNAKQARRLAQRVTRCAKIGRMRAERARTCARASTSRAKNKIQISNMAFEGNECVAYRTLHRKVNLNSFCELTKINKV